MTLSRITEHLSVAASGLDEAGADAADWVGMFGDGGVTDIFDGAGIASRGRRRGGARRGVVVANHSRTAMASHAANFPEVADNVADLSQVIPRRYRRTSLLWASAT